MERRKVFKEKLSKAWSVQFAADIPFDDGVPLSVWFSPREVVNANGTTLLNWTRWSNRPSSVDQSEGLGDLILKSSSFLLWKKAGFSSGYKDDDCYEVKDETEKTRCIKFADATEGNLSLASREEIRVSSRSATGSERVFVLLSSEKESVDAILILDHIDTSIFKEEERSWRRLTEAANGDPIFRIRSLISDTRREKQAGTRILNHVLTSYPCSLFVADVPLDLPSLKFYNSQGFAYSDLKDGSHNLLPEVLDILCTCVRAWHDGDPTLTYLTSECEGKRIRLSSYESERDVKDALRYDVASVRYVDDSQSFSKELVRFMEQGYKKVYVWVDDVSRSDHVERAWNAVCTSVMSLSRTDFVEFVDVLVPRMYSSEVVHRCYSILNTFPKASGMAPPSDETYFSL